MWDRFGTRVQPTTSRDNGPNYSDWGAPCFVWRAAFTMSGWRVECMECGQSLSQLSVCLRFFSSVITTRFELVRLVPRTDIPPEVVERVPAGTPPEREPVQRGPAESYAGVLLGEVALGESAILSDYARAIHQMLGPALMTKLKPLNREDGWPSG